MGADAASEFDLVETRAPRVAAAPSMSRPGRGDGVSGRARRRDAVDGRVSASRERAAAGVDAITL